MRILQVHNKYLHYGGEDAVVDNEFKLLKDNNVAIEQLFFDNTSINPLLLLSNRESFKRTEEVIKKFKPNILHVHNLFYQATPSVLKAAKKHGVKVVMTLHNFRLLCPGGLFLRNSQVCTKCKDLKFPIYAVKHKCFQDSYLKSLALSFSSGFNNQMDTWDKYVDKFIVLTPFIKDLLLSSSLGVTEDKINIKPNSTDDFFINKKEDQERAGYLFVGRLSKEKGVDVLVNAFNKLNLKLDIIGTGDLKEELESISGSNITFHGSKNRDFIKQKLFNTKALMFPSIWYEGLPNTIIEAYSSGTPIVASNIDNINNLVKDGYNGDLFIANDPYSLAEAVLNFDKKDLSFYQKNARKTFEDKYKHDINLKNLLNLYSQLHDS